MFLSTPRELGENQAVWSFFSIPNETMKVIGFFDLEKDTDFVSNYRNHLEAFPCLFFFFFPFLQEGLSAQHCCYNPPLP